MTNKRFMLLFVICEKKITTEFDYQHGHSRMVSFNTGEDKKGGSSNTLTNVKFIVNKGVLKILQFR